MDTFNEVISYTRTLQGMIREATQEFREEELEVPSWQDVQKKDVLYKTYSEVVRKNHKVNKLLSRAGSLIMSLKELRQSLAKDASVPGSLKRSYKDQIDTGIESLYECQKVLAHHKDSYETALRFFNSAQYILSSPRLNSLD